MLRFDEELHKYYDGDKELISVTTLLKKHGLAPDYSGVSEAVLNKKAERGTLVHEEIENYIKNGEIGFTEELSEFIKYVKENNIEIIASEKMVFNDICAGRFDLLCKRNDKIIRVDFKVTYKINKDYVDWQLSVYDYLDTVKADELEVWHFNENGELEVVGLPFKPKEQIESLFDCERNGTTFILPSIEIEENAVAIIKEASAIIERAKAEQKEAESRLEAVKEAVLNAMEEHGVKKFENDYFSITYIAPVEKTSVDTTRLKKERPEIAKEFEKTTTQKASVRITLKGDK